MVELGFGDVSVCGGRKLENSEKSSMEQGKNTQQT